MKCVRFGIITLKPLGGLLIRVKRLLHISELHLIHLGQVLLLRGRTAQVSS